MTWPPRRRYGITRQLASRGALEDIVREVWRDRVPGYTIDAGRLWEDGPPLIVVRPTEPRPDAWQQVAAIPRWPDVAREVTYFSIEHFERDRRDYIRELDERVTQTINDCRATNGDGPWEP